MDALKDNRIFNPTIEYIKKVKEGDSIWFHEEKQKYKVQAASERFLICTKPFNPKKTVLYTVVDLKQGLRGVDNYGGLGYESKEDCKDALKMFVSGEAEFSRRRPPIKLNIISISLEQ